MTQHIQFHFDPLCPWAWQSSRWMREVTKVRDVDVEWRLFSLKLINEGREDPLADKHERGTPAMRTLALVQRERGNDFVGDLYESLGTRVHEDQEEISPEVVEKALIDANLDPGMMAAALEDDATMQEVRDEHRAAVDIAGCFGVPTIVLESGRGLFGPVIATAPVGEAAGEMWDHFCYFADKDGFFELKRERDRRPGTPK
ncbi:MAG: DsbA family protein [Actinomycetota bacterium]|nr:DsbA family protein [Actinomycetota bacterium]